LKKWVYGAPADRSAGVFIKGYGMRCNCKNAELRPHALRYGFLWIWIACSCAGITDQPLPRVEPVDLNEIDPNQFSRDEWYVPYYLKNFSAVANSLTDTGEHRGFINLAIWRTHDVNKPYNARIMENVLSLVWFYTTKRPWNPYYNDPALRERIEAALTFWCSIQSEDGKFSEYAPGKWSLAPTAFATKFIGRALYLLEKGPTIDDKVLARANESLRKALFVSFTDSAFWAHGRNFTNQYENLWGGAMMYLQHHPDQTIDQLLTNRLNDSMEEFQSPCGYFYEKNGPDWGYNLSTHHSDLQVAWHYAKATRLQDYFTNKTARWYDWFSYNAVKEPGSLRYYLNKGIETRQLRWFIDTDTLEDPRSARWTPQAEVIPLARAFTLSKEAYEQACGNAYSQMRAAYPNVDELRIGEFWSFSPYAFLHHDMKHWLPTQQQKEEAIGNLPYLKNENFTEVRSDRRNGTNYTFARRPSYYAIFNGGKILTDQQRYGLGLVWNPSMGTVFQSQSRSDSTCWGTKPKYDAQVYEASDVMTSFIVNENPWKPAPGRNEMEGSVRISYPLGQSGVKTIRFDDKSIEVNIQHGGPFIEVIPLIAEHDAALKVSDNTIVLQTQRGTMTIQTKLPVGITLRHQSVKIRGGKACRVVEIHGTGKLSYSIGFTEY
jgi:hypothetical protein